MPWNFQQRDFPILTPGQMSPVNQAFAQALDNYVKQANASAKLTYADLMGPQFLAKALGNENILGNDPTAKQDIKAIVNAGRGAIGAGSSTSTGSLWDSLKNLVHNAMHGGTAENPIEQPQQSQQTQTFAPATGPLPPKTTGPDNRYEYDAQGNNKTIPQQQVEDISQNGNGVVPIPATVPTEQPSTSQAVEVGRNTGEMLKQKEIGKALGTTIGNQIKEMDDEYQTTIKLQDNLESVRQDLVDPEFRKMRQLSVGGKYELKYFMANGTPAQKELIGKLIGDTNQVVLAAAGPLKGAFRQGEQTLIQHAKVDENDNPDVAVGKWESMQVLNELANRRLSYATQYMLANHTTKGQAMAAAQRAIPGDEIRQQVENSIHPKIKIRNKKTGEEKTISVKEARALGIQI